MPEIEKLCDEVAIIDRGRIIRQGLLETMLQEEKTDSVVIELLSSSPAQLHELVQKHEDVEVIDATTLVMEQQNSTKMGALLALRHHQS
jgi:ABC-2 type transport system ATP-binding protein